MLEQKIERLIEEAIQEIEEAVHRNHPYLDKRKTGSGLEANQVRKNRKKLANAIKVAREMEQPRGNNEAAVISKTGFNDRNDIGFQAHRSPKARRLANQIGIYNATDVINATPYFNKPAKK